MADHVFKKANAPVRGVHLIGVLAFLLVAGSPFFHGEWLGMLVMWSGILILSLSRGRLDNPRLTLPAMAWTLVLLAILRLLDWFPCEAGCQGGGYYQHIGPVPMMVPALISYVLLAVLATRDALRGGWCPWLVRMVWFLAGISVFFFFVGSALGLSCVFCNICHLLTAILVITALPYPAGVRWWHALAWMFAGTLVMNGVYHHTPVPDVLPSTQQTTQPESQALKQADAGRTYGYASSPKTLEVVIDLTCRHCAEQYRPLMEALKPIIAAKRVRVVVRHLVRPSQGASGPAAELALAAAALQEHAAALEILLGSNPDAGFAGLKARLGEVIDSVKVDGVLDQDRAAITALLNDDQQRISQLGVGPRTPSAVLIEDGKVIKTWSGDLPIPAIVAALDGAL